MAIERYTYAPTVNDFLVIDELTTITEIRDFVWGYVDVRGVSGNVSVFGQLLIVGNRLGRSGDIHAGTPEGQQLVIATNPEYVIGEKA
jgi:hypothetical protein